MDFSKRGSYEGKGYEEVMSMLSVYISSQVRKKGAKSIILKVESMIVKATKSKKDDEMLEKIKKVLKDY